MSHIIKFRETFESNYVEKKRPPQEQWPYRDFCGLLGPRAENAETLKRLIDAAVDAHVTMRKRFRPEDPCFNQMTQRRGHKDTKIRRKP